MAIYDAGTASLSANGAVTGVGTIWQAPLTLIRVGATIVFKTEPVQIYTISEIISDTQINVYNPNSETVPAGTGYAILAHDGITVQGLAQDVAETLRYYQSNESYVAQAVDAFANFDANDFDTKVTQVNTQHGEILNTGSQVANDAYQVSLDRSAAEESANNAMLYSNLAVDAANSVADSITISFASGGQISSKTQRVIYNSGGSIESYYWDGDLPKTIPENSSPTSTGDIGTGGWILADNSIRVVGSVESLSSLYPVREREVVFVSSYFQGNSYGGGFFVSVSEGLSRYTVESGLSFQSPKEGFLWQRMVESRVYPEFFGALINSTNDQTDALQKMLDCGVPSQINGNFFARNLVMRGKSCSIYGSGMHSARITQVEGAVGSLIEISDTCSLVVIDSIGFYGTGAGQDTPFTLGSAGVFIKTPSGLSVDYPYNTSADPRRDLTLRNVHVIGFDVYGVKVDPGNYSASLVSVLIQHIKKDGLITETTDFTWTDIQVNTCGRNCLVVRNAGNCRFVGGKFIWSGWSNYEEEIYSSGVLVDNSQNVIFSNVEAQDCGGHGIRINNSSNVVFNGVNSNRNSINSNYSYYNMSFGNSTCSIYGFVGLNYVSNNGDGRPTSAGNFHFSDSKSSLTIDGVLEAGYFGPNFSGDENIINTYSGDIKINGIKDFRRSINNGINGSYAFDGVSTSPVFVASTSVSGQAYALRLSQSNRDKIIFTGFNPSLGFTACANISPTIVGAEDFNLVSIGTGFGNSSESLYFQYNVMQSGDHSVSLLISSSGQTRVLSGVLPQSFRMQSGGSYNFALGFSPGGKVWWSIVDISTGRRCRRSFNDQYIDIDIRGILTNPSNNVTIYSAQGANDIACSGIGWGAYVGFYSSESDYCASRYYSLSGPVDVDKKFAFTYLNGDLTSGV